ncbi:CYTH domain-containing protein [Corynebacterium sp. ES2775-CONJ]|uniref:CYTH domain-containing protein n=1 Tax=Corynebacterium sp. ES2775-CONJ TaxID=2974029 RepID=UPI002169C335|nr:CYTH domain-containing protein [Corynebacterium sp. ES2775-CONJ]MCS4490618.1 CYTH domain-containing protein [Corynebacterium sp. ES2775-CONJ]
MHNTSQIEVESKFDISSEAAGPNLDKVKGISSLAATEFHKLSALYYDTPDLRLCRTRITLRYRHGGKDEGWTLKLPGERGRIEIHSSAPADCGTPKYLTDFIVAVTRGKELVQVARIDNQREETALHDNDGVALLEFCDDHVNTECFIPGGRNLTWREWEIELTQPALERNDAFLLMESAAEILKCAGAQPASSPSKLRSALGQAFDLAPTPPLPASLDTCSPVHNLWEILVQAKDQLIASDIGWRLDKENSLESLGTAINTLLQSLSATTDFFTADRLQVLEQSLRTLANSIQRCREVGLVTDLVDREFSSILQEGVVDSESTYTITRNLENELRSRLQFMIAQFTHPSYYELLDELDAFLSDPPLVTAVSAAIKYDDGQNNDALAGGRKRSLEILNRTYENLYHELRATDQRLKNSRNTPHHVELLSEIVNQTQQLALLAELLPKDGETITSSKLVAKNICGARDYLAGLNMISEAQQSDGFSSERAYVYGMALQRVRQFFLEALEEYHRAMNRLIECEGV